jgi:hypothetical protein
MRSPSCLCSPHPFLNAWTNFHETWYVYHGIGAHLNGVVYKSLPSVCVSLPSLQGNGSVKCLPPFGDTQRLGKHVPAATNIRNNTRIARHVIFCAVHVLLKETVQVCLCILLRLLGNNSIKTFPLQRRIVGSVFSMRSLPYQRKVGD